ncbi:VWA domain-containing protein [Actinophytocola oryzae]|uniref:Ca-activated chloride channel family protein n=1 Tax=Actinophytocola oryzae TaxID=502181 RepID=A0A4R7W3Y6_9PSEU|nr:VWA domain-containing protein [Actinophytocola oryzae]TDV57274.1 Ca-activated chloride channel family protein [Actinophytocola oryzae]
MSLSGFIAPWWLLLYLVVAALVVGYVAVTRGRKKQLLRFANLELLERVAPGRLGWSRHLPAALLIVALSLFTLGMAGPTAEEKVPRNRATVMLVIDVSLSMESVDVRPTRLAAAQAAATTFVKDMTPGINLGLISFAGTATALVAPTTERAGVVRAIDHLELAESTATGEAVFAAMKAIDGFSTIVGGAEGPPPARIVLMTDGKQTVPNTNPEDPRGAYVAAREAQKRHIPISTISFGTEIGTVTINGREVLVPVDDNAMREIARLSGGDFHKAASADELKRVYGTLGEQIGYEIKNADASRPWLMLGTLVLFAAAGTSLLIGQRLP